MGNLITADRRLNRRAIPEPADFDRVFSGPNPFSACSPADQTILRTELNRQREKLAILALGIGASTFSDGIPPAGHLYCILRGRVSLQWESEAGRSLTLFTCSEGELFGELQCQLLGAPPVGLGLQVRPVVARRCRTTHLLECPRAVVAELLKNQTFERQLARAALDRLRGGVAVMSLALMNNPGLALAHLCVSPSCGIDLRLHPALEYLGSAVTVDKTVTIKELEQLSGLATNTVRKWLRILEDSGYIRTARHTVHATRLVVNDIEGLLKALKNRTLTIAA